MKGVKTILRGAGVLALVCSLMISAAAYQAVGLTNFQKQTSYQSDIFSDIHLSDWYYENVASSYEYGIMNGKGSYFDPSGKVTLAESITIAVRLHSLYYYGELPDYFEPSEIWYEPYVFYVLDLGILSVEYPDYTVNATRAEFAKILAASIDPIDLAEINYVDDGAIPDVSMNSDYADAVYLLYRAGVLTGSGEQGAFNPNATITRAEAAAIITRIVDPNLRKTIELIGEY